MNYELLLKLHIRRKPTDGLIGKFGQQPQVVEIFQRTVQTTPIDDGSRLMEIDVRMPTQLIDCQRVQIEFADIRPTEREIRQR